MSELLEGVQCTVYLVLFGGEVVLPCHLEAVVSVQDSGHLQCGHLLDQPWQLSPSQLPGLRVKLAQPGLSLLDVLPARGAEDSGHWLQPTCIVVLFF